MDSLYRRFFKQILLNAVRVGVWKRYKCINAFSCRVKFMHQTSIVWRSSFFCLQPEICLYPRKWRIISNSTLETPSTVFSVSSRYTFHAQISHWPTTVWTHWVCISIVAYGLTLRWPYLSYPMTSSMWWISSNLSLKITVWK